jgi:hypothetical protein
VLLIRADQMKAFELTARQRFEDEMFAHGKHFSPRLSEVIGDEQLRLAIRSAIARAEAYAFTYRGPIRLFIELMFLCGSGFDTDPQYPAVGKLLRATADDQMVRAQRIHEGHNDYLDRVSGPGAVNVHRALRGVLAFARAPLAVPADDLRAGLLREMHRIFPEKAVYVGDEGLRALIDESVAEARRYRFDGARPVALLVVLKFAFGHGCTDDPLYPWIAKTLRDEKIVSPEARAARLEKKALTWLEHVIARNERGTLQ